MSNSMTKYMEEQISIYRAAIGEIETRRPDLKNPHTHARMDDDDARQLNAYRASLQVLETSVEAAAEGPAVGLN